MFKNPGNRGHRYEGSNTYRTWEGEQEDYIHDGSEGPVVLKLRRYIPIYRDIGYRGDFPEAGQNPTPWVRVYHRPVYPVYQSEKGDLRISRHPLRLLAAVV